MKQLFHINRWRLVVSAVALSVLAACGGGGGASVSPNESVSTGASGATTAAASMTGSSTSKVLNATQSDALTMTSVAASDGSTQTTITLPTDVATNMAVQTGETIVMPAGQNKQFPLGFAAVVGQTTKDPVSGQTIVDVSPSTLRDAYSKLSMQGSDIPLSADNFVGAIAPLAIGGGDATPTATQTGLLQQTGKVKVFNGALTLK